MRAKTGRAPAERASFGRYVALTVIALLVVLPLYSTLIGSLKPGTKFLDFPRTLYPVDLTFDTLREAWSGAHMGRYLFSSVIVSVAITVGQLVTSTLAAYAFSFLEFPLKRVLFLMFIATLMVPAEATMLVNRETMSTWHWTNSYRALIVPFLATAFGTFLMRQVFMTVPRDLIDASQIDGIGHWRFLTGVAVPIARPTLGALGLFSFLAAWNQYLWPILVTDSERTRTVQIGLKYLQSSSIDRLNLLLAGSVIASLPIFVLLAVFQRQLVKGLTAGAVKG
jgi:sn-glycerol 3-phosphate transport system permease protein